MVHCYLDDFGQWLVGQWQTRECLLSMWECQWSDWRRKAEIPYTRYANPYATLRYTVCRLPYKLISRRFRTPSDLSSLGKPIQVGRKIRHSTVRFVFRFVFARIATWSDQFCLVRKSQGIMLVRLHVFQFCRIRHNSLYRVCVESRV